MADSKEGDKSALYHALRGAFGAHESIGTTQEQMGEAGETKARYQGFFRTTGKIEQGTDSEQLLLTDQQDVQPAPHKPVTQAEAMIRAQYKTTDEGGSGDSI